MEEPSKNEGGVEESDDSTDQAISNVTSQLEDATIEERADDDDKEEIAAVNAEIQICNEERDRISKEIMGILADQGIADPDEVYLLASEKKRLPETQATLLDLGASAVALEEKRVEKKSQLEQLQDEFDFSRQDIEQRLQLVENKLNIAEQESHHVESILAQQVNLLRNTDEVNQKIAQQQQCLDSSKQVLAEFESEDNRAFRKRIQQDIASNLLTISNDYLEKITA